MNRILTATLVAATLGVTPALAQDQAAPAEGAGDLTATLPFDAEVRQTSVDALQSTVYDLIALRQVAHQAHWNVVGSDYYQLHEFYEELYTDVGGYIDGAAERIRSLGVPADGRNAATAENTLVDEGELAEMTGAETLQALYDNWATVANTLHDRIEATDDDLVTQDYLIGVSYTLDKELWQLRAHLQDGPLQAQQ